MANTTDPEGSITKLSEQDRGKLEQQVQRADRISRLLSNDDFKAIICELYVTRGTEELAKAATIKQYDDPTEYQNLMAQLHARHHLDLWMSRQIESARMAQNFLDQQEQ